MKSDGAWPHMTAPRDAEEKSLQQRIEAVESAVWALIENPLTPAASAAKARAYMLSKEKCG